MSHGRIGLVNFKAYEKDSLMKRTSCGRTWTTGISWIDKRSGYKAYISVRFCYNTVNCLQYTSITTHSCTERFKTAAVLIAGITAQACMARKCNGSESPGQLQQRSCAFSIKIVQPGHTLWEKRRKFREESQLRYSRPLWQCFKFTYRVFLLWCNEAN